MTMGELLQAIFIGVVATFVAGAIVYFLNNTLNWRLLDRITLFFASTSEARVGPLESLLSFYPNDTNLRRQLSDSYYHMGKIGQAITAFLPLATSEASTHFDAIHLAKLYFEAGKLRETEQWVRNALKQSPYRIEYIFLLTDVLIERGKTNDAIEELSKAVHIHFQLIDKLDKNKFTIIEAQTGAHYSVFDSSLIPKYQSLVKLQQKLILIYEKKNSKAN
jgi:tetratricopeptide (TPR) repeat protein